MDLFRLSLSFSLAVQTLIELLLLTRRETADLYIGNHFSLRHQSPPLPLPSKYKAQQLVSVTVNIVVMIGLKKKYENL